MLDRYYYPKLAAHVEAVPWEPVIQYCANSEKYVLQHESRSMLTCAIPFQAEVQQPDCLLQGRCLSFNC